LPDGLGVVLVAVALPCFEFVGEELLVGDAAIQTLRREHAEFGFGHSIRAAVGAAFSGLVGPRSARMFRSSTSCISKSAVSMPIPVTSD
jgi:hypothetical protein